MIGLKILARLGEVHLILKPNALPLNVHIAHPCITLLHETTSYSSS